MDIARDLTRTLRQPLHSRAIVLLAGGPAQLIDVDVQQGDLLAQIVVQLTGNPLPLELLAGNEAASQFAIRARC